MSLFNLIKESNIPKIKVIANPHKDKSVLIWSPPAGFNKGYVGKEESDSGFFYCPYIPLLRSAPLKSPGVSIRSYA